MLARAMVVSQFHDHETEYVRDTHGRQAGRKYKRVRCQIEGQHMRRSLTLGYVKGIRISVHWTFLILIAWIAITNFREEKGWGELVLTVCFICSLFVCVILHELGHALTALAFGIRTQSITLLPIGGVAQMDQLPEKPSQELMVALAGPAINLIIAGILYAVISVFGLMPGLMDVLFIKEETFLFSLFGANVVLAVFNLIPAFPMDGGRVFRAILSFRFGRERATGIAAVAGEIIAIGFIGAGLFYNPFLVFAGIFVYLGAYSEAAFVHSKAVFQRYRVKDLLISDFHAVRPHDKLSDAAKLLLEVQAKDFVVTENGTVLGTLTRDDIIRALRKRGTDTPVSDIMDRNFVSFSAQDRADRVFMESVRGRQSVFPVVDDGNLIGVVDSENLAEFLMINEARIGSRKRHMI